MPSREYIVVAMKKNIETAGRRGRRLSFDRDSALETALRLFWTRGYEGTSVADLIGAMGITPPSLYTAFGSKEDLYREALELYRDRYAAFVATALTEESTAYRSIERLLMEAAANYCDPAVPNGCMVSTAVLSCAPEHDGIARQVASMRQQTIDAVAGRFSRAIETGELPKGTNVMTLARYVVAIIQGMSVQARDGAETEDLLEIARTALLVWPKKPIEQETISCN